MADRSGRGSECGYQDSACHRRPVEKMPPFTLIFPLRHPIRPAGSALKGTSFATGLPCLVMTIPSGPTRSRRERHCSLNFADAIVFTVREIQSSPDYRLDIFYVYVGAGSSRPGRRALPDPEVTNHQMSKRRPNHLRHPVRLEDPVSPAFDSFLSKYSFFPLRKR